MNGLVADRRLVIFGIGVVADVVYRHVRAAQYYEVAGFTVDTPFVPTHGQYHGLPVVSFDEVTTAFPPATHDLLVAVGYHDLNALRRQKFNEAKARGYHLASYVSPRAACGEWLEIGENCIILDNSILEPGARLGDNVTVWSGVLVGHHVTIHDHCWVAGNVTFGGSANIGGGSFVGLGAIIGNEVEVGEHSFVGAGTLLTKCIPSKSVVIARATDIFRLDSEAFLRISKMN